MSPLWVSYRSMTSRFLPFAFVEMVSPYNKKNITRWLEDMNFMFRWQKQYLTRSLRSLVRYCSCHSNIKFISSRHRVISSIYMRNQAGRPYRWVPDPDDLTKKWGTVNSLVDKRCCGVRNYNLSLCLCLCLLSWLKNTKQNYSVYVRPEQGQNSAWGALLQQLA